MSSTSKQWDELLRLRDTVAEAVDQAGEKDLVEDLQAAGHDPKKVLTTFDEIVQRATSAAGKLRLRQAQAEIRQANRVASTRKSVDVAKARARLKELISRDPSFQGGFMLAARNAGAKGVDELSDNDVLVMYEMAIATGHIPSDDSK